MRSVLVTGASKGIGEACVKRLAASGFRVFAGVRRVADGETLVAKAGERITPLILDVTNPAQLRAAADEIREVVGSAGLWGLVNNAGIAVAGPLEFLPLDDLRHQLDVNVVGQVAVTQAVLPLIRAARGRIVFMGSISGRSALPFTGAYAASKHALEAVNDAWRVELESWGITVSIVEPGAIVTPIWETSIARGAELADSLPPDAAAHYGPPLEGIRRHAERTAAGHGLPPDAVARVVEHALTAHRSKPRYVVGRDARIRLLVNALLPTALRDRLIAKRIARLGRSS